MGQFDDYEELLSDARVQRVASRVVDKYRPLGLPDDADFATYIQPPQVIDRNGVKVPIPEVAVFAVLVDNPRAKGKRIMKTASVWLQDWRAMDSFGSHYVSNGIDPALPIFGRLARECVQNLQDLKELI